MYSASRTKAGDDLIRRGSKRRVMQVVAAPTTDYATWTTEDVIKWLTSLELEEHCPAFQQKGITGKNLAALTAADLDEMGVKKLGPKKKLLKSLRELGSPKEQRYKLPTEGKSVRKWTNKEVLGWLVMIGMDRYLDTFQENDITGLELPALEDSDLEEMGVGMADHESLLKAIHELKKRKEESVSSGESGATDKKKKAAAAAAGGVDRKNSDGSSSSSRRSMRSDDSGVVNLRRGMSVGKDINKVARDNVSTDSEEFISPSAGGGDRGEGKSMRGHADHAQVILSSFDKGELRMGSIIALTSTGTVNMGQWRGTKVAVKQMKILDTNSRKVLDDFHNEVLILSRLRHPHIVNLMGYCYSPPDCLLVMEWVERGSLDELLHAPGTIALTQKLDIAKQIATGMDFIHQSKIMHRDLKPKNILMDKHLQVKICDFGLSKTKDHTQTYQGTNGTAAYMAPELLDNDMRGRFGGLSDNRIDVYSFAITIWEIFARERPWQDKVLAQLVFPVLSGKRPEPMPACPPGVKSLIENCWREDFKKRPFFSDICIQLDKIIEELEDEVTVTPEMKLKNAELEAEREKTKALLKQVKQLEKDKKKLEGKSEKKSKKKEPKAEKKGGFLSKKSSKKTTDKFLSIG